MKRCPQCLFLFPDSDEKCDFDQTPLEVVDDSAVESATRPKKSRALFIVAGVALILGVLAVALYYGLVQRSQKASAATESSNEVPPVATPSPASSPSPSPLPSPSPSPSPSTLPGSDSWSTGRDWIAGRTCMRSRN